MPTRLQSFAVAAALPLVLGACAFSHAPVVRPEAKAAPVERIGGRMLLLVPTEVASYYLMKSSGGSTIRYDYGPGTVAALADLFRGCMDSVEVRMLPVSSSAMAMLTLPEMDVSGYDFIGLPSIKAQPFQRAFAGRGVDFQVQVDVMSGARKPVASLMGNAAAAAPFEMASSIRAAGNRALENALKVMRDQLATERPRFLQVLSAK
ncbi:MAG: hypothetical protein NW201_12600 [Gemmatimonadales bacterium]|nr:hypothetical protein [Gemmatimonadales bacterium]